MWRVDSVSQDYERIGEKNWARILSIAGLCTPPAWVCSPFIVVSLSRLLLGFKQVREDEKSSKLVGNVFFRSDNNLMSAGLHDRLQPQQRSRRNELQALEQCPVSCCMER